LKNLIIQHSHFYVGGKAFIRGTLEVLFSSGFQHLKIMKKIVFDPNYHHGTELLPTGNIALNGSGSRLMKSLVMSSAP